MFPGLSGLYGTANFCYLGNNTLESSSTKTLAPGSVLELRRPAEAALALLWIAQCHLHETLKSYYMEVPAISRGVRAILDKPYVHFSLMSSGFY